MEEFIIIFADQFEETEKSLFTSETFFKDLDEWDSLTALAIINIVDLKFQKKITIEELNNLQTIRDIYEKINE